MTDTHHLCSLLRQLRQAAGLSLSQFEARFGIPAVVIGAYERGDRTPTVVKIDTVLACYGYALEALPIGGTPAAARLPLPRGLFLELRAMPGALDAFARYGYKLVGVEDTAELCVRLPEDIIADLRTIADNLEASTLFTVEQ